MKHFKKSAMMTALCLAGGLVYTANVQAEMVYNPDYIPDLDEVDIPASSLDGFDEPFPELPPETTVLAADDGSDVVQIKGLCEFRWHGSQMNGMEVTFLLASDADPEKKATWVWDPIPDDPGSGVIDLPPPKSGKAVVDFGTGAWELVQPDDTFKHVWRLKATGDVPPLVGVRLDGLADLDGDKKGTVFDIYYSPVMTPGSKRGRPFQWTARPGDLMAPTGEYSQPIGIRGDKNSPYGDLFGTLTVNFPEAWDGSGFVDFVAYIADTDCADLAVPVVDLEAMPIRSGIHLKWAPGPVDPSLGYVVYRQQKGGQLELLDVVSNPMFKDKDVESGAVYTYSVVALEEGDDSGDPSLSAQAAEVTATAK